VSCSQLREGAIFIALVALSTIWRGWPRGKPSLLTLSELPRPRSSLGVFCGALRGRKNARCIWLATSSETRGLVSHENCTVRGDAYVIVPHLALYMKYVNTLATLDRRVCTHAQDWREGWIIDYRLYCM